MSKRKKSIFKKRRKINVGFIIFVLCLIGVLGLFLSYAISAIMSDKDELYKKGTEYYDKGLYDAAIESFNQALDEKQLYSKRKDMNIKLYLADSCLKSARYTEAAAIYGELSEASFNSGGTDVSDLKDLAVALSDFSKGNYGGAIDVLKSQAKTYPELNMYIGTCYAVTDDVENMFKCYETYVQAFGFNSYIYAMYGSYYLNKGDMESSIAYIENGLSCNDTVYRKELLLLQVNYYEKKGDYDTAYELSCQLVEEYPDFEKGKNEQTFLSTRVAQD